MTKRQRREHREAAATQAANERQNASRKIQEQVIPFGVDFHKEDEIAQVEPVNAVRVQSDKEVSIRMTQERNDWINASIDHARIQTQQKV